MIEFSVIIPFHNDWESCLNLVKKYLDYFAGNNSSYELIIIDDASRLTHSQTLTNKLPGNQHIKYFLLEENAGQFGAIALGISKSSGDQIIITDQDMTFVSKEDLDELMKFSDECDLQYLYDDGSGNSASRRLFSSIWHLMIVLNTRRNLTLQNPLPFRLIKRSLLNEIVSDNYIVTALDIELLKHTKGLRFQKIANPPSSHIERKSQYSISLLFKVGIYFFISLFIQNKTILLASSLIFLVVIGYVTASMATVLIALLALVLLAYSIYIINHQQSYSRQIEQINIS